MLSNGGAGEDFSESLRDKPSQSWGKSSLNIHWKLEGEVPILWPSDVKSQLTGKEPDAGKDWRQEKGVTEDEMVGWHQQLNRHECEQAPGDRDRQGSLLCAVQWGWKKELDWGTEQQQRRFKIIQQSTLRAAGQPPCCVLWLPWQRPSLCQKCPSAVALPTNLAHLFFQVSSQISLLPWLLTHYLREMRVSLTTTLNCLMLSPRLPYQASPGQGLMCSSCCPTTELRTVPWAYSLWDTHDDKIT